MPPLFATLRVREAMQTAMATPRREGRSAACVRAWADIASTPQNPLEDMAHTEALNFVMKGGEVVRQQTQPWADRTCRII